MIGRCFKVFRVLWTDNWQWFLIVVVGISAFAFGLVGFWKYFQTTGETRSILDIIYLDFQLFTLESGSRDGRIPWELEVGRVLVPIALFGSAMKLILLFLRDQVRTIFLAFYKNHVIVCGLGRKGMQIVQECRKEGRRVVVIEADSENDRIEYCQKLGVIVIAGDATKVATLKDANVESARALVAICGNDGTNIQIAMCANEIAGDCPNRASSNNLQCLVQVMNFSMATLFKEHPLFTDSGDCCTVRVFNAYENAIRQLFQAHPIDKERLAPDDPRHPHLIILGIGQMGESAIVQAAKLAHFANEKRLKVIALDRAAKKREKSLLVRHPNLKKVCDLEFEDVEFDDADTLSRIAALADDASTLSSILICSDNDARNVEYALSIRSR